MRGFEQKCRCVLRSRVYVTKKATAGWLAGRRQGGQVKVNSKGLWVNASGSCRRLEGRDWPYLACLEECV